MFHPSHAISLLIIFLLIAINNSTLRDIHCNDPDVGGTVQNRKRQFILLGVDASEGAGIGNLLIYFPAIYYFAAFSGRDIMIQDSSILGKREINFIMTLNLFAFITLRSCGYLEFIGCMYSDFDK